jgi:hypothetical protein
MQSKLNWTLFYIGLGSSFGKSPKHEVLYFKIHSQKCFGGSIKWQKKKIKNQN